MVFLLSGCIVLPCQMRRVEARDTPLYMNGNTVMIGEVSTLYEAECFTHVDTKGFDVVKLNRPFRWVGIPCS